MSECESTQKSKTISKNNGKKKHQNQTGDAAAHNSNIHTFVFSRNHYLQLTIASSSVFLQQSLTAFVKGADRLLTSKTN